MVNAGVYGWVTSVTGWGQKAYSCSPESHALVYAILVMAVGISAGGVLVWKRYIRSQPTIA